MTILVIDDSVDSQELIKKFLKIQGYSNFLCCSSADCAFNELKLAEPEYPASEVDLILLDIVMPDVDGIETCSRIKSDERYKDVPVIMVTASTDESNLQQAFAVGATDYITKPLGKVELLARVRAALKLKEETDCRKVREQELLQALKQLEEANETLQKLSSLDGLTGIANRRSFDQTLNKEWNLAVRQGSLLSLILFDIDFFKAYNDSYGHQAGDDCLKQVSYAADALIRRPADLLARYGGEEFAVILPNTTSKGAALVAENIRQAISSQQIPHSASCIAGHVTISVGVMTMMPLQQDALTELIEEADKALYQAKQNGRNRVITTKNMEY
ncbi:diguanylate cyclase [Anaerospora sp.]|uniref:diguanylate cyclase n=1 Tax=Anaerospora sp. TaxID=1960278 RepID=UPI0028A29D28|nr:diguanylate cyclase [Anaerospora sp.]